MQLSAMLADEHILIFLLLSAADFYDKNKTILS
jgi:hypothetical protein